MTKKSRLILILWAIPLFAQSNSGELRLKVLDPAGLGVRTAVQITSKANQYRSTLTTNDQGNLDAKRLRFGIYQVQIEVPGFAPVSEQAEIRSALPLDRTIRLKVAPVSESVNVSASAALIDPHSSGRFGQSARYGRDRGPIDRAARTRHAGPGELSTGLAL